MTTYEELSEMAFEYLDDIERARFGLALTLPNGTVISAVYTRGTYILDDGVEYVECDWYDAHKAMVNALAFDAGGFVEWADEVA